MKIDNLLMNIKTLTIHKKEEDIRLQLFGALLPMLLSKDIFKKNSDVKPFIDSLMLESEFKNYLYASRTQIVAKMARELEKINKESMNNVILIMQENISNYELNKDSNCKNEKKQSETNINNITAVLNKYSRNKEDS
ncbi:hypothetical protein [Carnobacterium maltaromaticum]|uniref:hypothetical protein n=1 Tax=Carnobacterium maltaromaticum TaxID=2751 RepID=UPI0039AF76FA